MVSALLLIIFGIVAIYLGAANLYRYTWWSSHYGGEYTDSGMWTKETVASYVIWGSFFSVVGFLGVLGGLILFFKGLPAVAENNKPYLRKILVPMALVGFLAGGIIVGIMLIFVWLMYQDDMYDFFGLLLEDVTRARGRAPMAAGAPGPAVADPRAAYATGYQQQSLYTDDYARAQYGGGQDAYTAGGSLMDQEISAPVVPVAAAPTAPQAAPEAAPMCSRCGKPTEWIEEYGRFYCYDCDAYV